MKIIAFFPFPALSPVVAKYRYETISIKVDKVFAISGVRAIAKLTTIFFAAVLRYRSQSNSPHLMIWQTNQAVSEIISAGIQT
ncbi:hypothetical protein BX666DRAFT_1969800 [Dichotomocladium elegans]|nr:hypothetical protein BX666DRAFT_1969800 [Dichotomocladium elegans]